MTRTKFQDSIDEDIVELLTVLFEISHKYV